MSRQCIKKLWPPYGEGIFFECFDSGASSRVYSFYVAEPASSLVDGKLDIQVVNRFSNKYFIDV